MYFRTSHYLQWPPELTVFIAITVIIGVLGNYRVGIRYAIVSCFFIPFWLPEWIQKHKYFGDIIFRRVKIYKGEVLGNYVGRKRRNWLMLISVPNEETGLEEEFWYYNYDDNEGLEGEGINKFDNIESIEFSYLEKSKLILEVSDFTIREDKKGTVSLESKISKENRASKKGKVDNVRKTSKNKKKR